MALTFDVRKINGYDEALHGTNGEPSVITTVMIFGTMNTGVNPVRTPRQQAEFYARLKVAEKYLGALAVHGDGSPWLITADDVKAHVGLHTNASTIPLTTWIARVAKQAKADRADVLDTWRAAHRDFGALTA